ncbi:hypothetical protein ElP_26000 [Tautonia plasticadhaerens]|uniref:Uncharacterized protein n=1 Tax=Tautonia plasticadhaerens TaxID=2527974 RepID=A0A518H1J3_9BACT|nr:hypothetical protein ElP_26000 [Tautonia plasticadhaerens]
MNPRKNLTPAREDVLRPSRPSPAFAIAFAVWIDPEALAGLGVFLRSLGEFLGDLAKFIGPFVIAGLASQF